MQVEGQHDPSSLGLMATGARVRNAYRICPLLGDSLAKVRLIPDAKLKSHDFDLKEIRYRMAMRLIR